MKKSILLALVAAVLFVSSTAMAGITNEISFGAGLMKGSWDDNLSALDSNDTEGSAFNLGYALYFADLREAANPETVVFTQHPSRINLDYGVSSFSEDLPGGGTYDEDFDAFSLSSWGYLPFGLGFGAGLSKGEIEYGAATTSSRDYDELFYGISYYIANKPHRISLIQSNEEFGAESPTGSPGYEDKQNALQWTSLFGDFFAFNLIYSTGDREYASGGADADLDMLGVGFGLILSSEFSIYLDINQKEFVRTLPTNKYEGDTVTVSLQPVFWIGNSVGLGVELAVARAERKNVSNLGVYLMNEDETEIEVGFDLKVRF